MNQNFPNSDRPDDLDYKAEETLRQVARLSPPEDLIGRIHQRIAQVTPERRGFWSLWLPAQRLQFAAAAVLVVAVAGAAWSVHHQHSQPGTARQVAAPALPVTTPRAGGFDSAGAERVPPTLKPIQVQPAPKKKKPAAGHGSLKPSAKSATAPPSTAQVVGQSPR